MIVATLFGGLGNQMFIYAMARALSLRNKEDLVIDTKNGFKRDFAFNRTYALEAFPIKYTQNRILSFDFFGGYVCKKISDKIGRHLLMPDYPVDNEVSNFSFEEKWIKNCYDKVLLNGSWCNERYFKEYEEQIREDYSFSEIKFSKEVLKQAERIKCTLGTPVAVGVRTYNEIKDSTVRNGGFFYTKDDFYLKAMMLVKERVPDAVFYVFTQDFEWVLNNLDFDLFNIVIIEEKFSADKDVGDIYLMSLCQHFVISNSTFYWWGTWLSKNMKKMVLVPKEWTNSVLDSWIKI